MSKDLKGTFTLKVPKDRSLKDHFVIELRDMDESVYLTTMKLINAGKQTEAVKFVVKNLRVGGDSADDFAQNFLAVQSANLALVELITPLEGELKKN